MYTGLIIDFRLLCSLLFLEHSIKIQSETSDGDTEPVEFENNERNSTARVMNSSDRQRRNAGFLIGFSCFLAPFFSAVQYVPLNCIFLSIYAPLLISLTRLV